MPLAVDIHQLLKGGTIEWERIDFRKHFHPLAVLRSICGFANDIKKTGGGYIIIGVEPDEDHVPIFPVRGLSPGEITIFKREIVRICKYIHPPYYPIIEVDDFKNKQLLVLSVPVGANRPYQVPQGLMKPTQYSFYIRTSTTTRKATLHEELELISLANQIPFDDQIHHLANITDLNFHLIQAYLIAIKSSLVAQLEDIPFVDVCKRINIAGDVGRGEVKPKNAGLLLFNNHPEKFFSSAFIELTEFDDLGRYKEKIFTGPLFHQIDTVLTYIKGMVITKRGEESPQVGEEPEHFNYPFKAIKETVINAVYHRDYKENAPIEIRVLPKGIEIISWPGPLPPLDNQRLTLGKVSVRRYRNPGLGHFLKQLRLVGGKATGLERIRFVMEKSGNPAPVFETDKKRTFFKVFLPIHPKFVPQEPILDVPAKPVKAVGEIVLRLSQVCPKNIDTKNAALVLLGAQREVSLEHLMVELNQTNKSRFRNNSIKPLMVLGLLQYTVAHKPKSGKQRYIITDQARAILIEEDKNL